MKKESKGDNIILYTIGIFLVLSNIASHTMYESISLILIIILGIFNIFKTKKIYINIYFLLYLLFLAYHIILIFSGTALDKNTSLSIIKTLLINLFLLIMLYNLIIENNNTNKISKVFIISSVISLGIIMFLQRDSLLTGRLAHSYGEDSISYYFLGKAVAISGNSIAFICAISATMSLYFFKVNKKNIYLIFSIFLCIGVVLTGSRKGILVLGILFLFIINLIYKKNKLKQIIIILVGGVTALLIITKVPTFYNILGQRLIELINKILGLTTTEGSIVARERYKLYAIKLFKEAPTFGYGLGYFKYLYNNVTESNYLEMLVSGGIVGLILYYITLIPIFVKYYSQKNKNNITKIFFYILLCILIIDYGSVTYLSRTYIIFNIVLLASLKINNKKLNNSNIVIRRKQNENKQ